MKNLNRECWLLTLVVLGFSSYSAQAACAPWMRFVNGKPSIQVEWTGYKTTEKLGVKGSFDRVEFHSSHEMSCAAAEVLEGATAEIDLQSVNSGNPVRDANLKMGFFALFSETGKATAVLAQVKEKDSNSGSAVLQLTLSRKGKMQANLIPLTYRIVGKPGERVFEATGSFDLIQMGASNALESVAGICHEVHKGKDGVSKTWSEVAVKISAQLAH